MGRKRKLRGRGRQHLLTTKEMCDIYRVCRKTIYNWRLIGMPVEVNFQGTLLFSKLKVKKWMQDYGKEEPTLEG